MSMQKVEALTIAITRAEVKEKNVASADDGF